MAVITEKNLIKTEVVFSRDKQHRYLLRKEWDKNKSKAMVIMINPSIATEVLIDHTTMYVMNNLFKLNFGTVDIVNIFSNVDGSRKTKTCIPESEKENENQIVMSAEKVDTIIIAWGSVGDNSKSIQERQSAILNMLRQHEDKLFMIGDYRGNVGLHPLAPQIRSGWNLVKFQIQADVVKVENKQNDEMIELTVEPLEKGEE